MEGTNVEPLKVVELGDKRYHISPFSAKVGSYLLMRFLKQFRELLKNLEDEGVEGTEDDGRGDTTEFSESLLQTLLSEMSFKDYDEVQRLALQVVTRTDVFSDGSREFQQPLLSPTGAILVFELKNDTATIANLTSQSLFANLAPFFTKTGLKAMMRGELPSFSR